MVVNYNPESDGIQRIHIEMQLAHAPKNEAEGAYNNALHLRQRRIMMQSRADFLDKARDSTKAGQPMKARSGVKQLNAMPVHALRPIA
jgi:hypothetical protein